MAGSFNLPIKTATAMAFTVGATTYSATTVGEFYPTTISRPAWAQRMTTLDLAPLGTADSITVSGLSAGRITHRTGQLFDLDLSGITSAADISFNYAAVKSGVTINGVCTVTVSPATEQLGWGEAKYLYHPVNGSGAFDFTPGRNHRKVHVGSAGWTKAQIQAATGTGNANAAWLRDNPAAVVHGGDGTLRYGETPALALDAVSARSLWDLISPVSVNGSSNWLLFEGGQEFDFFYGAEGLRGESKLHPLVIGSYGPGGYAAIRTAPKLQPGFPNNVALQNLKIRESLATSQWSFVVLDGIHLRGELTGDLLNDGYLQRCVTVRRFRSFDTSKNPPATAQWREKTDRASSYFASRVEGVLFDGYFNDVAGWQLGYPSAAPFLSTLPQPPTKYSHGSYCSNIGFGKDDPDAAESGAPIGMRDLTIRNSVYARGSLTGVQGRPGLIVLNSMFIGNNLALTMGGGGDIATGIEKGQYSLVMDCVVSAAGFKTGQGNFSRGKGISNGAKDSSVARTIVAHSGAGEDGITAHGVSSGLGEALENDPNGTWWRAPDAKIRGWENSGQDLNLSGLNLATLDATTLGAFADTLLGTSGNDYRDLLTYMRTMDVPTDMLDDILNYFRTAFGYPLPGHSPTTVTFQPDSEGRGPGNRWDVAIDWSIGDVPRDGDTVVLKGYRVTMYDNCDLAALDIGTGHLIKWGGLLTTNSLSADAGSVIELHGSGQFWTDGYTDTGALTINLDDGRFMNTGAFTGPASIEVAGQGECILGFGDSSFTLKSGQVLEVNGDDCRVGWDGAGGTSSFTMEAGSTLRFKPQARVEFTNRFTAIKELVSAPGATPKVTRDHGFADFYPGITIGNGTWSAVVVEKEDLPNSLTSFNEVDLTNIWGFPQQANTPVSAIGGYIYLKDLTGGLPAANDDISGTGRLFFVPLDFGISFEGVTGQKPKVIGTPTFTLGKLAKFRSGINGTTDPAVTVPVVLNGTLAVDLIGMATGVTYDLIVADSITGTFASVSITGGSGSISYTATKVILTVT